MKVGEYVRFKRNKEPCIQYKVLEDPIIEYDEVILNKYCLQVELEVIGLVPVELLEITDNIDNISAIDLAIDLSQVYNVNKYKL